ncbi:hypothetical protein QFC22_004673 [Naganishia vaughanmartiniae]|uniref:Uncharacterized protein n=1 Tax=Naganishia vaughanmartiniae TaxID=1424756 RepID=A0ACC2X0T7_9TREE|nr:hypothetical protein QFC22_004673 [Naganishia vaughanmartiniae]
MQGWLFKEVGPPNISILEAQEPIATTSDSTIKMKLHLIRLADLDSKHFHIPAYKSFPNTSLRPTHPLFVYRSAFHAPSSSTSLNKAVSSSEFASAVEQHLRDVGVVKPAWRYTMYSQHHYHSTTDEVLVVTSLTGARLCFGGAGRETFKDAVEVDVAQGDVIIVPAGVGHALLHEQLTPLEEQEGQGFQMVGSYPVGATNWDMCTSGDAGDEALVADRWKRIQGLTWFPKDPAYGSAVTPAMEECTP